MEIGDIINTLVSAAIGLGGSSLIFYKSNKRAQNADASMKEFNAMQMQVTHFSQQLKEAYETNDLMQKLLDDERNKLVEMNRQYADIRIEMIKLSEKLTIAERNKCEVENCLNRKPPRNENN